MTCLLKIEELGAQGMVDEAQSLMTQVEELEKEKNSYSARSGSRVRMYACNNHITSFIPVNAQLSGPLCTFFILKELKSFG